ncbi:MAG TPA: NAD(+)/NADH kinase [Candidatus Nitrosocosmicus sp.]
MRKKIHCISIFTKHGNDEASKVSILLKEKLIENGFAVVDYLSNKDQIVENAYKIDLVIAVGGDGTALRTFRTLNYDIPVLSINAGGTRGILSEISKDNATSIIPYLLDGNYYFDNRIRILAQIDEKLFYHALNDFVLVRTDITKTPTFHFSLCGDSFSQKMDGMIISTPTGSTGHSLSIGGPILHENLDCMLITPVASINRIPSFVISGTDKLDLQINYNTNLIIDGQQIKEIPKNEKIYISRYQHDAVFLRLNKNKLRQMNKLGY